MLEKIFYMSGLGDSIEIKLKDKTEREDLIFRNAVTGKVTQYSWSTKVRRPNGSKFNLYLQELEKVVGLPRNSLTYINGWENSSGFAGCDAPLHRFLVKFKIKLNITEKDINDKLHKICKILNKSQTYHPSRDKTVPKEWDKFDVYSSGDFFYQNFIPHDSLIKDLEESKLLRAKFPKAGI